MKIITTLLSIILVGVTAYSSEIKVTIQIFSGRQNPEFFIKDAELVSKINNMIQNSTVTSTVMTKTTFPYRGCLLELINNNEFSSVLVQNGTIVNNTEEGAVYQDVARKLEDCILSIALEKEVINSDLRKELDKIRDGHYETPGSEVFNPQPPSYIPAPPPETPRE